MFGPLNFFFFYFLAHFAFSFQEFTDIYACLYWNDDSYSLINGAERANRKKWILRQYDV